MKDENNLEREKRKIIKYVVLLILFILIILCLLIWIWRTKAGTIPVDSHEGITVGETKEFIVTSQNERWTEDLNIFDKAEYNGKSIIYPSINGTYSFELNNKLDEDVICKISFEEDNEEQIPMKYRLKEDSNYIRGNENDFINYNDLNVSDILITSNTIKRYILEWKWEDLGENSNKYGDIEKDVNYKLRITIEAEGKI